MEIRENDSEEREEGEIVDDELEDVSDYSINSPLIPGKSISPTEHLRAVSLSSISDSDLEDGNVRLTYNRHFIPLSNEGVRRYRSLVIHKHRRPKSRRKSTQKRTRKRSVSSSDSENEKLDRRTLRQLKEAVRINKSREMHIQNSLRTRLKGLIEPSSAKPQSEEEPEIEQLRTDALASKVADEKQDEIEPKQQESNLDDKELTELRLEALKSAMLKKHLERKKRKAMGDQNSETPKTESAEGDKENAQDNINTESAENEAKKTATEQNVSNTTVEEDIDIMRAMLLASMSKKIATMPSLPVSTPTLLPTAPVVPKLITRTVANPKPNAIVRKPVPFTRAAKSNYFSNRVVINNVKPSANGKVPHPKMPSVPPLIIQVNNDSDSDMDLESPPPEDNITKTVTEFLKKQRAEVEAKTKQKPTDSSPEKSVVKLLPISQQLEYHKLKQQLINAKKRPRIRRFSQKNTPDAKRENVVNKKTVKSKFLVAKFNNGKVVKRVDKNDASSLQRTLKDLQVQKDGRLQVKGKYQELAPLLKRINQVNTERKCYETDIKHLLQELEKTKAKLNNSHQSFKCLVEELMNKKEKIDKCATDATQKLVTSTPHKLVKVRISNDLCGLDESEIAPCTNERKEETKKDCCSETVVVYENAVKGGMDQILDPNDINEIFVIRDARGSKSVVPEYISPLGTKSCDTAAVDPLATYCPFDLLGVCRDKECPYKHCS